MQDGGQDNEEVDDGLSDGDIANGEELETAVNGEGSSSQPSKKKKKKKKKKKGANPEDGPEAPTPPKKPPVVFIDDPNWVMTTIPAGWSTDVPQPVAPREDISEAVREVQPPTGWDDTPVRAMLRDAMRREELLRERLASGGPNPTPAAQRTNIHEFQPPQPIRQGWDAPIQGVQFISTGFVGGQMWNTDDPSESVPKESGSKLTELD
ncbi:hypothetical protein HDU97_008514 [Phlyctochytrium planicorne]|nr:hypothetical protein HDU97_008514 [Phlyctochytrium planicorne]